MTILAANSKSEIRDLQFKRGLPLSCGHVKLRLRLKAYLSGPFV